jgi:hypothetical protein
VTKRAADAIRQAMEEWLPRCHDALAVLIAIRVLDGHRHVAGMCVRAQSACERNVLQMRLSVSVCVSLHHQGGGIGALVVCFVRISLYAALTSLFSLFCVFCTLHLCPTTATVRRAAGCLDALWLSLQQTMWPRLLSLMDAHAQSIKEKANTALDKSAGLGPHYVTVCEL